MKKRMYFKKNGVLNKVNVSGLSDVKEDMKTLGLAFMRIQVGADIGSAIMVIVK